jgi:hypothetical protein
MKKLHKLRMRETNSFGHYFTRLNDRMRFFFELDFCDHDIKQVGIQYWGDDSSAFFTISLKDEEWRGKTYKAGLMYCYFAEDALQAFLHEDGHWVWSPKEEEEDEDD